MIDRRLQQASPPASGAAVNREERFDARRDSGRLVTIQRDLVTELDATHARLDAYVGSYIRLREQAVACTNVRDLLAWAKREPQRLDDSFFMQQLSEQLSRLRPLAQVLKPVVVLVADLDPSVNDRIGRHDKMLFEASDAVAIVENPSQDADVRGAADTIARSMHGMRPEIEALSEECKSFAEDHLLRLRDVITSIFAVERNRQMAARGQPMPIRRKRIQEHHEPGSAVTSPIERNNQAEVISRSSSSKQ